MSVLNKNIIKSVNEAETHGDSKLITSAHK